MRIQMNYFREYKMTFRYMLNKVNIIGLDYLILKRTFLAFIICTIYIPAEAKSITGDKAI